ncbi:adult-specific cuticular protein ACP-20-like [Ostrea edulis]|uniref:adult-specific cuticular protein ACP-20-like n=1 Tax=Ostrea edulis TaxID=37623 RepID=UPI002094F649|nr:adult-specific cuticular protein ACP-20-like [Ostrea edulis]
MNKSVILMVLPCVIALAVVVVEGLYYYPGSQTSALGGLGGGYGGLGGGYGGLGGGYGGQGNYASRQAYQQRYLQEWYQTRQQRNQLNKLAKQSAFSSFVNYIPLVLLLTALTNNTALPIIG